MLEFVNLAELLQDNRELLQHMKVTISQGVVHLNECVVQDILYYIQGTMLYGISTAILLLKYPEKIIEDMAYGKLIMQEAAIHSGEGEAATKQSSTPPVPSELPTFLPQSPSGEGKGSTQALFILGKGIPPVTELVV